MSSVNHPKWKVVLWAADSVEPAMLRVPVIVLVFLFLWAINLWLLDKLRIQYGFVLSIKSAGLPALFAVIAILVSIYGAVFSVLSSSLNYSIAVCVSVFYTIVLVLHAMPISMGSDARASFYRLLRSVLWPVGVISFPEVLLADALTSMSKVLKDFGTYLVVLYATTQGRNIIDFHDKAMVLVALLASAPFIIRVRQCYLQLDACVDWIAKVPVALNILKYMSAFPPIWLTAATSLGYVHASMPQVIMIAAAINSLYSLLWDLIMDWGLITFTRDGRVLRRQRTLLPWPTYVVAVLLNACLRFSWTINRWPGMSHVHSSVIVLIIELGEVFRRAVWNIFRIEWEIIVQLDKAATKDVESEKLLEWE